MAANDEMRRLLHVSVLDDHSNTFDLDGNILVLLVSGSDSVDEDLAELRGDVQFELEEVLGKFVEVMAAVASESSVHYLQLPVFDAVAAQADLIYGRSISELRRTIEG